MHSVTRQTPLCGCCSDLQWVWCSQDSGPALLRLWPRPRLRRQPRPAVFAPFGRHFRSPAGMAFLPVTSPGPPFSVSCRAAQHCCHRHDKRHLHQCTRKANCPPTSVKAPWSENVTLRIRKASVSIGETREAALKFGACSTGNSQHRPGFFSKEKAARRRSLDKMHMSCEHGVYLALILACP